MIDPNLRLRLIDYFEAGELAEMIGISVEDLIDAFEDEILEAQDDLVEFMDYGTRSN